MNAPPALATRPSTQLAPPPADDELGLAALLALFIADESADAPAERRSIRSSATRLRAWAQEWVERATAWGAGPGGAWRAW